MSEDQSGNYARFGKYLLLDHLVDGGMAEIYRARELADNISKIVADKIVAIKVIRKQYSADAEFKRMFLDEIKVAFALIHPNISQTYNYGELTGKLFTVMEYVHGKNLHQFLKQLRKEKKVFPIEIAVYITAQICQGLDYAHKFTDKLSGKKLQLIHRDISPHNIMMDYDGMIKVIDFGIAKADTNTEKTQAGTIKGKVSYLAPEYLQEGTTIDHRYDQFAVGLVLWELLTGKRVFSGENDMAILKKVFDCKIPAPSAINPNVPRELEAILGKALSKDPNNRFEDMDKFNRALSKFLNITYSDFSSGDVAKFITTNFSQEILDQQNKLQSFGSIDLTPFCNDYKAEIEGKPSSADVPVDPKKNLLGGKGPLHKISDGSGSNTEPGTDTQKRVFGQTTITDVNDKTISPFIKKMRKIKEETKTNMKLKEFQDSQKSQEAEKKKG